MRMILMSLSHAPLPELDQHAGADAQHHVGLAPQIAAERQRHAQRIAAVEHAAAAAIAEHRRLQHGGQRGDFLRGALRAAAADDHRIFGRAQKLGGLADRGLVELGRAHRQRRLRRHRARFAPDVDRALQRRRARPARRHRPHGLGDQPRRLLGFPDQRGIIHQPLDDSGLVADLVQVTEMAPDVGVGNLADQRQHRRIHRIGGEQGGRGVEQARPRHHGIGRGLAGRQRGAQRHIGSALLVPGVDRPHPVGCLEQRREQVIVLHPRQRVDRANAVGDHGVHRRLGGGHRGGRPGRLLADFLTGSLHAYRSGNEFMMIIAFRELVGRRLAECLFQDRVDLSGAIKPRQRAVDQQPERTIVARQRQRVGLVAEILVADRKARAPALLQHGGDDAAIREVGVDLVIR